MRSRIALPALAVIGPFVFGCGQTPSPATSPGPSTAAPASGQGFNASEAAALLKTVTEATRSGSGTTAVSGANNSTLSVGSHTIKTSADIPLPTLMHGESAVITLGGKKLVVEFDKGRVLLDDTEQAKLPPGTKVVEIQFVGGKLSVTADGTTVLAPTAP